MLTFEEVCHHAEEHFRKDGRQLSRLYILGSEWIALSDRYTKGLGVLTRGIKINGISGEIHSITLNARSLEGATPVSLAINWN